MIKRLLFILALFRSLGIYSQYTFYHGYIGNQSIKLITLNSSGNFITGIYSYDKYNTPIEFHGSFKQDTMVLYENYIWNKYDWDKYNAIIKFDNFDIHNKKLVGKWINQSQTKELSILILKDTTIDPSNVQIDSLELLQSASTKEDYFKILITNYGNGAKVFGVKVYSKRKNEMKQEILFDDDIDLRMFGNVSVDDYNNDGIEDFAILVPDNNGNNPTGTCYIRKGEKYFGNDCSFDYIT